MMDVGGTMTDVEGSILTRLLHSKSKISTRRSHILVLGSRFSVLVSFFHFSSTFLRLFFGKSACFPKRSRRVLEEASNKPVFFYFLISCIPLWEVVCSFWCCEIVIKYHSKPFKTIQNHSKSFKIIQNHSKIWSSSDFMLANI